MVWRTNFARVSIFSIIPGLHINLHKSYLYVVSLESEDVQNIASSLGCLVGSSPMRYLGL